MQPTGIQIQSYADGKVVSLDTRYPEARKAVLASMARLSGATRLSDAQAAVRRLEHQLNQHAVILGGTEFVPQIERELAEAGLMLAKLLAVAQ